VNNAEAPGLPASLDPDKQLAAKKAASKGETRDDADDDAAPTAPGQDLLLRETEHILVDYTNLLNRPSSPTLTLR
jgi:hypothetical protein